MHVVALILGFFNVGRVAEAARFTPTAARLTPPGRQQWKLGCLPWKQRWVLQSAEFALQKPHRLRLQRVWVGRTSGILPPHAQRWLRDTCNTLCFRRTSDAPSGSLQEEGCSRCKIAAASQAFGEEGTFAFAEPRFQPEARPAPAAQS